jgi:hypothetical protein
VRQKSRLCTFWNLSRKSAQNCNRFSCLHHGSIHPRLCRHFVMRWPIASSKLLRPNHPQRNSLNDLHHSASTHLPRFLPKLPNSTRSPPRDFTSLQERLALVPSVYGAIPTGKKRSITPFACPLLINEGNTPSRPRRPYRRYPVDDSPIDPIPDHIAIFFAAEPPSVLKTYKAPYNCRLRT